MTTELVYVRAEQTEALLRVWTDAVPTILIPYRSDEDDHPITIDEAIDEARKAEVRWPNIRSGERDEIPWPIRLGVGRRDNFTCRYCHAGIGQRDLELDHIVPWSAGGTDRSENLRILCKFCNQKRSNFIDGTETRPVRPVTWWCVECWHEESHFRQELGSREHGIYDMNISHRVYDGPVIAYCAECRHISRTDVTL